MPRRSGDGTKPFELRTGIGGLPILGGMFRSGDPATVPPHKFHLLINMRRTPIGLITRPGLELEFDTGVQECINGLTEDSGLHGGAILLYPGAEAGSNPATFRAIFPDSSSDYSEFAFALYGPAATTRSTNSPVLAYTTGGSYVGPTWLSRPFIFRGQACQFGLVDRNGTPTVALLEINLAPRSFLQASDCWRNEDGPVGDPLCPGPAGQPTPAGDNPPLWPFQHPVGSVRVATYFDNPFGSGDWRPDASTLGATVIVDDIITTQERIDDVLTGTPGVGEVLYFVARQGAGPVARRLVRWDGAGQSTEFSSIPDDVQPRLGVQAYGPYLVSAGVAASAADWAAHRLETGAWAAISGCAPATATAATGVKALAFGGYGVVVASTQYAGDVRKVEVFRRVASDFDTVVGTPASQTGAGKFAVALDAVALGDLVYTLVYQKSISEFLGVVIMDQAGSNIGYVTVYSEASGVGSNNVWLQVIGGRVYLGGYFSVYDPAADAPDVAHHGVYDITFPELFAVYRVDDTDQLYDSQTERYSLGALAAVPSDDDGGEGFQAS